MYHLEFDINFFFFATAKYRHCLYKTEKIPKFLEIHNVVHYLYKLF